MEDDSGSSRDHVLKKIERMPTFVSEEHFGAIYAACECALHCSAII